MSDKHNAARTKIGILRTTLFEWSTSAQKDTMSSSR